MDTINIEFWWKAYSGYLAGCWRELAKQPDVSLSVLAACGEEMKQTPFDQGLLQDVPVELAWPDKLRECVSQRAADTKPRLLAISGWVNPVFKQFAPMAKASGATLVLTLDNPWCGTWKQRLARWVLPNYLSLFSAAVVPGERAWQFARRLGFSDRPIYKGLYGVDSTPLEAAYETRCSQAAWPKAFLFAGRLSQEKGIVSLKDAYRTYRTLSTNPWPLHIAGDGPLRKELQGIAGVQLLGFLQPQEMQAVWKASGVFVLPSTYDPWPLVIVEACRAGLPVLHSTACGSAVELLREGFNGFSFPAGDAPALARLMLRTEQEYKRLPVYGRRSIEFARPYESTNWAQHWASMAANLLQTS